MLSLWFITPAFRRFELTALCLAEHQWAIRQLEAEGIAAISCVIADDDNLATAERLGCATVRLNNRRLGAKFNAGYQFAAAEGADYVFPIGSDSWLDPRPLARLLPLARRDEPAALACVRYMAIVAPDGDRRADLYVGGISGVSWAAPTALLADSRWRPLPDELQSGCDSAALRTFEAAARRLQQGIGLRYRYSEGHPLEMVGWKSRERGITPYERLRDRWATAERRRPFDGLDAVYPADLVAQARAFYRRQPGG